MTARCGTRTPRSRQRTDWGGHEGTDFVAADSGSAGADGVQRDDRAARGRHLLAQRVGHVSGTRGDRQRVPDGARRVGGGLLPDPAELLGGLHRVGPEARQHHGRLGLRHLGRLPVLAVDGLVPLRHQGRPAVQVLRQRDHARRRIDEPVRRRQQDPRRAPQLSPLPDAEHDAGIGRLEHAVAGQERHVAARELDDTGRLDREPQLLVVLQLRARRLRPLRLPRSDEHPDADDHGVPHRRLDRGDHRHPGRATADRRASCRRRPGTTPRRTRRSSRSRTLPCPPARSSTTSRTGCCRPAPWSARWARSSRRRPWRTRCSSTATSRRRRRTPTCSRHRRPGTRRTSAAATSWRTCRTTSCRSCTSRRSRPSRSTTGATAETVNQSSDFEVQFYSIVMYGATKQVDAVGSTDNSQIGNTQIAGLARRQRHGGAVAAVGDGPSRWTRSPRW